MRKVVFAALALVAAQSAQAQRAHTPATGSAERQSILNALRPSIEATLGPNVEFVVNDLKVYRGWAFVLADPQRRGGRKIDGRRYVGDAVDLGGIETSAVLRMTKGRWNLVNSAIGATDVWYCDLGPREIHPYC